MSNHKVSPETLRATAKALEADDLRHACREEGLTRNQALRVARGLVHDVDIDGAEEKKGSAAIELAKRIVRMQHKADDPGYPESSREMYRKSSGNETLRKLFAKHYGPSDEKAVESDEVAEDIESNEVVEDVEVPDLL